MFPTLVLLILILWWGDGMHFIREAGFVAFGRSRERAWRLRVGLVCLEWDDIFFTIS